MSRSLIVSAAALLLASGVRAAVCGEVPRDDGRGLANLALRPGVKVEASSVYGSTSQEMLQWVRATAPPPATFSQKDRPADLRDAAVPLPRNYPPFDPRPSRPPAGPNAICLNGSDWRLELVEEGHRSLRTMIENDGKRWMACTVPGSVQSALLERGQISLPDGQVPLPDYFGTNSLHLTTATVYESWFKKSFRVPEDWKGRWVRLRLGAVDYRARFYLNGQSLGEHEGHFEPVTLDASAAIRPGAENLLTVQIAPFPRNRTLCARSQILKNLQSDCTPAASPLGISDDVFLLASDTLAVDDLCVRPTLADDFGRASVALRLTVTSRADCDVEIISTIRSLQEPRQTYTGRQAARVDRKSVV